MTIETHENMTDEQMLQLGDDAFLAALPPEMQETPAAQEPVAEPEASVAEENPNPEPAAPEPEAGGAADADGAEGDGKEGKEPEAPVLSDDELKEPPAAKDDKKPEDNKTPEGSEKKPEGEGEPAPKEGEGDGKKKEEAPEAAAEIDHKAEYSKLIGVPIKANGREITLKSTDEALRLIQQGAGYAQKMEQLKPARKSAAMLEAAGLLGNETALAQMIDLFKGDPKAIAKMLKDTNTDIFSLDLEAGATYTPESHLQSDAAVTFTDTLKEVRTLPGGREAMALIDGMDDKSKELIWGNAEAVRQIYEYKQNGVYDTVATELERRRTLGQIPEGTPYIIAFQQVGEDIAKANEAAEAARKAAEQQTPPVAEPAKPAPRAPIASGAAPRKPEAPNPQAAAAAAPRSGGVAKTVPNIYNLTDADIEKMSAPPV